MIVVAKKVGRLANRLLLFAQFAAAATELGVAVVNPSFVPFHRHFPTTARDLLCRFPARASLPLASLGREALYRATLLVADLLAALERRGRRAGLIRLRREEHLDLASPLFVAAVRRHRLLFVQDWNFRAPDWCERHRDTIRPYFRPFERHLAAARALVEPARAGGRFVVGVHVRRTDYARFKGGRWFYSLEQYRGFLERARRVFGDRDVAFLVCSDEALPREPFAGLEAHFGGRDGLEDLYALAGCDALLGPPSTYGRWASWWGGVPRYTIFDSERPFDAASFVVDTTLSPRPPLPATGAVG